MRSITAARARQKIASSPAGPAIRAGRRLLRGCDGRIIECLPLFYTDSAGSRRNRAAVTLQAANQTFPLMVELLSRTGRKIEDPVGIGDFVDSDDKLAAAEHLKNLFDHYGSDKATGHDYHLLYGAILAEPDSVRALLEIGIGTNNLAVLSNMGRNGKPGASLRAFREFLPNARIYGADIDREILFSEERITTLFVDQTDPESFDVIADAIGDNFDLIIDDGLHSLHANLGTLLFGLERLKVGGCFVVEDITPPALPVWQTVIALMPQQYDCHIVASKGVFLFLVRRSA